DGRRVVGRAVVGHDDLVAIDGGVLVQEALDADPQLLGPVAGRNDDRYERAARWIAHDGRSRRRATHISKRSRGWAPGTRRRPSSSQAGVPVTLASMAASVDSCSAASIAPDSTAWRAASAPAPAAATSSSGTAGSSSGRFSTKWAWNRDRSRGSKASG